MPTPKKLRSTSTMGSQMRQQNFRPKSLILLLHQLREINRIKEPLFGFFWLVVYSAVDLLILDE